MRIETDKFMSVKLLTDCNTGVEPIYGKGTGKGEMNCPECCWCVGNVLYDEKTRKFVGHFETVCRCGIQIDYSNAEKYI